PAVPRPGRADHHRSRLHPHTEVARAVADRRAARRAEAGDEPAGGPGDRGARGTPAPGRAHGAGHGHDPVGRGGVGAPHGIGRDRRRGRPARGAGDGAAPAVARAREAGRVRTRGPARDRADRSRATAHLEGRAASSRRVSRVQSRARGNGRGRLQPRGVSLRRGSARGSGLPGGLAGSPGGANGPGARAGRRRSRRLPRRGRRARARRHDRPAGDRRGSVVRHARRRADPWGRRRAGRRDGIGDRHDHPPPRARDRGPPIDHLRNERHYDHLQAAAVRVAVLLLAATPLAAQEPRADLPTAAKTGVILDAYSFGSGFAFHNVVEWTVPVTVSHHLGPRLTVDLSAAFARASGATTSGTFLLSGLTDTDVRASWATVSGHLIISVAGTLPTGQATVSDSSVPLLSALATDLLAFTTA